RAGCERPWRGSEPPPGGAAGGRATPSGPGVGGSAGDAGSAGLGASRGFLCSAVTSVSSSSPIFRAVPPAGVSRACSSCVRAADVKDACSQCDRFVCQSCSRLCSCCSALTCSCCATVDYGDLGEQVLCNGCSIFQV
ncbi:PREDICTED: apoptosis regulatory protein Siva-like, partial [Merops nubicus]|uniref:apoptosis regulatory protein Siva-like n=1 Tax=Merops nubicus TaxID=57421 RepID=UPI0004F06914